MRDPCLPRRTRTPRIAVLAGAVFAVAALACATAAHAQWAWRDASGNTTYSDTPPPSDVRPTDILRQPAVQDVPAPSGNSSGGAGGEYSGNRTADAPTSPPAASGEQAPKASAPPPARTLADQEADFRKRQAERDKAAAKAAEEQAKAEQRAASCAQAKGYLQMMEDGVRLMRPDAEGNRNFLDDDQRAAEKQKAQDTVDRDC